MAFTRETGLTAVTLSEDGERMYTLGATALHTVFQFSLAERRGASRS